MLCRTRMMVMTTKTYEGSLTIYWSTNEKGSDGKYHTVSHSQTLTAEVEAPYPTYFWGQNKFKHPQCVTKSILKTEETVQDNQSIITVNAHGYRCERRLSYISKKGNDGQWHDVPVYWDDYQPIVGQGSILILEDNDKEDANMTQSQRVDHISDVLGKAGMSVYRKHIASKLRN